MSLWSNVDANTGAPKFAVAGGLGVSANGSVLYGNTTANVHVSGIEVGVFGVSAVEAANTVGEGHKTTHSGWTLRTEGTGGRAGRVFYETLVATGTMQDDANTDNTVLGA